ncbi:ribosomal protein L35 [Acidimicrobium ferrooxidans DSM 10331]|uniref:Large ribosomal subunit protein bL35 n=1 Tax=Acidimicrobium ferrooxidans (strain DSM 10331 / JCM 15462 / NBRC 103882 / ICP) TaxID=525909 RepID=C7M0T5_ACIFD|nr:50S ribosomal protein L35 [Acidimicrobium ferrooxidans]ACU54593.1 ribosomal protein L35 [Acidimicrobium ferrooxidans DSM 10331]
MPKMKTDTGAKARFKRTGTGKLMRRHAFTSHLLGKKSSSRLRRLHREGVLSRGDTRRALRQLGGR